MSENVPTDLFVGTYKYFSGEKFDDFLKALGVSFIIRKTACTQTPQIKIFKEGEYFIIQTISTFKNATLKFKLNEEFEEERMDGVKCKSLITQEGNKLIQHQKGKVSCEIIREFTDDELKAQSIKA